MTNPNSTPNPNPYPPQYQYPAQQGAYQGPPPVQYAAPDVAPTAQPQGIEQSGSAQGAPPQGGAAPSAKTPLWLTISRVAVWAAYIFVIVSTVLLSLAFVLRLFGASTDAAFTDWVYRNAQLAMRPFRGIFPPIELSDHSVVDTSLLFAILIYLLVAAAISALLHWLNAKADQVHSLPPK